MSDPVASYHFCAQWQDKPGEVRFFEGFFDRTQAMKSNDRDEVLQRIGAALAESNGLATPPKFVLISLSRL
jgi:hypothetical protein